MSDYTRKILLSLSPDLIRQLDEAAAVLGMCRSDVIRRSLQRDLSYVMSEELPRMRRLQQEAAAGHRSWLSSKRWLG